MDEWESNVSGRTGFTPAQKKMMQLSAESLGYICVYHFNTYATYIFSVKAFVEMARFLLKLPGVKYLLSERFCQDPLEEFFSQQRAQGRRNDNPTASEFKKTMVSRASTATDPLHGNCHG